VEQRRGVRAVHDGRDLEGELFDILELRQLGLRHGGRSLDEGDPLCVDLRERVPHRAVLGACLRRHGAEEASALEDASL
jgi:hypothetical protein